MRERQEFITSCSDPTWLNSWQGELFHITIVSKKPHEGLNYDHVLTQKYSCWQPLTAVSSMHVMSLNMIVGVAVYTLTAEEVLGEA